MRQPESRLYGYKELRENRMEKKKVSRKVDVVVFSLLFLFIVYLGTEVYKITGYLREEHPRKFVGSIELTEKDWLEDFDYLWTSVTESMPLLETYRRETGYDFAAKKPFYMDKLRECSTDYDRMCVTESVLNDLPGAHTTFFRADYDEITGYSCINSEAVRTVPELHDMMTLWADENRKYYDSHKYSRVQFGYAEGRYMFSCSVSDSDCYGYELLEIDGMSPREYIMENLSVYSLKYDVKRNQYYRPFIMFNENEGVKRSVTVKTTEGSLRTLELYSDLDFEYACTYGHVKVVDDIEKNYEISDIDEHTVYISVDGFSGSRGEELSGLIRSRCFRDGISVILDLRNNGGGHTEYGRDYIYPALFSEDASSEDELYIYRSPAVKIIYSGLYGIVQKIVHGYGKTDFSAGSDNFKNRFILQNINYEYRGENQHSPEVYVLVSGNTASAADNFTAVVSELDRVTVIGTNTGGEKLGGQLMDCLPNSRLVYMFTPSLQFNSDGTDNSLYGTAPDIYAELTVSGFMKRESLLRDSHHRNTDAVEDRLVWDDVLIRALKAIK